LTHAPKTKRLKRYQVVIVKAQKVLEVLKERRDKADELTVAIIELERAIDDVI
jgi:hypothetical protein